MILLQGYPAGATGNDDLARNLSLGRPSIRRYRRESGILGKVLSNAYFREQHGITANRLRKI